MGALRDIRRRRILSRYPLPDDLWADVLEQHPILRDLDEAETSRLRRLVTVFGHEKTFEAAHGVELDELHRTVIATQACLPILGLDLDWLTGWSTVVVVPREFVGEFTQIDDAGVVHEWQEEMGGESWDRGPLVVSWEDVEASGWGEGYSVVIHEVAHKLDLGDGAVNGRPALHADMDGSRWDATMAAALEELRRRGPRWRRGRIDPYAAEGPEELFAVCTESFFEEPRVLWKQLPAVYGELRTFYRQDPLARAQRRSGKA
jgi:Mlc titration factor MtfA (ptsG expression regulator)